MVQPPDDTLFTGVAGNDADTVMFEQYKLYLELTDKISERRQTANQFFLGMNTGLCALIGYLYSSDAGSELKTLAWAVPIAGILLSYFWYRLVKSYRDLNGAKFDVIQAIEQRLPLSPYRAEWAALEEGKNPKVYTPFSHLEIWVPRCFIGMFAALTMFLLVMAFRSAPQPKTIQNTPAAKATNNSNPKAHPKLKAPAPTQQGKPQASTSTNTKPKSPTKNVP